MRWLAVSVSRPSVSGAESPWCLMISQSAWAPAALIDGQMMPLAAICSHPKGL